MLGALDLEPNEINRFSLLRPRQSSALKTTPIIMAIPVAGEGVWIRPNTAAGVG